MSSKLTHSNIDVGDKGDNGGFNIVDIIEIGDYGNNDESCGRNSANLFHMTHE